MNFLVGFEAVTLQIAEVSQTFPEVAGIVLSASTKTNLNNCFRNLA
jgi:hypothetical protein